MPICGIQKQFLEETKAKLPLPPELGHLSQSSEIDETDIESAEILVKREPNEALDQSKFHHFVRFHAFLYHLY